MVWHVDNFPSNEDLKYTKFELIIIKKYKWNHLFACSDSNELEFILIGIRKLNGHLGLGTPHHAYDIIYYKSKEAKWTICIYPFVSWPIMVDTSFDSLNQLWMEYDDLYSESSLLVRALLLTYVICLMGLDCHMGSVMVHIHHNLARKYLYE